MKNQIGLMMLGLALSLGLGAGCGPVEGESVPETAEGGGATLSSQGASKTRYRVRVVRPHSSDPRYPDLANPVVDSRQLVGEVAEHLIFGGEEGGFLTLASEPLFLVLSTDSAALQHSLVRAQVRWRLQSKGPDVLLSPWVPATPSEDGVFVFFALDSEAWKRKVAILPGDRLIAEVKLESGSKTLVFYDSGAAPAVQRLALDHRDQRGNLYADLLSVKGYLIGEEVLENPSALTSTFQIEMAMIPAAVRFTVRERELPIFRWDSRKDQFKITKVDHPTAAHYVGDLELSGVEIGPAANSGEADGESKLQWIARDLIQEEGLASVLSFGLKSEERVRIRYYVKPTRQCRELKRAKKDGYAIGLSQLTHPKNYFPSKFGHPRTLRLNYSTLIRVMGGPDLMRVTGVEFEGLVTRRIWVGPEGSKNKIEPHWALSRLDRIETSFARGTPWMLELKGEELKPVHSPVKKTALKSCRGIPVPRS